MRAVIYARYSSEQQSEHSIDDQIRLCRARAEREGWQVVESYTDYALSGATTKRPGLQALSADARRGTFDIVLAEALDRISRDQEHVAGIFKTLTFAGARLVTISEGEINELHVGLKGTMNALFLKDLAAKTHRGLHGRVEAGKSGGGLCFGYDVVRAVDARGERLRGDRTINAEQAEVVRRIFRMFADGASPIAIAKSLNADGLQGPEGKAWQDTTIRGHALRGTGLLRNRLYIGEMIWNRMRFIRDPATGKRVSRLNPESQWVRHAVPALRIIDQDLWQAVEHRLAMVRAERGADEPDRPRYWEKRRAHHLLTQKVCCGVCGGLMTNVGRDYIACPSARKAGTCTNSRSMRRLELEGIIIDALHNRVMDPELFEAFAESFVEDWNRATRDAEAARDRVSRDLAKVQRKLTGLIDALSEGFRAPGLKEQLEVLETQRLDLTAKLAATDVPARPRLHPNLPQAYRQQIERLREALSDGSDKAAALETVRGLIDRIVLTPSATGGFEIAVEGDATSMLALGQAAASGTSNGGRRSYERSAVSELFHRSAKLVAGTGFEPVTFRL